MKILVADDDVTSLAMLSAMLKKHGYEVEAVGDGLAAWTALRREHAPPRIAVLDWMMPGMDGPEVCRRAREMNTDQPPYLILLTMRTEKTDIVTGLDAGADDYLPKPFHPEELRARIEVGRRLVNLQASISERMRELRKALDEVKTLRGIIPICAHCKKVRDDRGYWQQVESYVSKHSDADFSHGICPECMRQHYADVWPETTEGKPS